MSVIWFHTSTCFHLDQKLTQNAAQIMLYYHATKKFVLARINWSCLFDFRICSGKTLVAFDFVEKLTQSNAQISM